MSVKISIIVPVYNAENCLYKCVDSILSQTFTDFELLLIDDGSKDNSACICDNYSSIDGRITVLHKENGGVSSARNMGLEKTKGEWIAFIDADDTIDSDYLENLIALSCDSDMVISGFQYVRNEEKEMLPTSKITPSLSLTYDELFLLPHLMTTPWGKLYKSIIIRDNSIRFDEKMKMGEDTCFVASYMSHIHSVNFSDYAGYKYLFCSGPNLGKKYKMSTEKFVYHFTHIVNCLEQTSKSLNVSLKQSIENEKKFFFGLYIDILKNLNMRELRTYGRQYEFFKVRNLIPVGLGSRKRILLNMAIHYPILFYLVARMLVVRQYLKNRI